MNGLADERKGATDDYFVANACWLWTLRIMADAAAILGNDEDAALYRELREKTLAAFRDEYVTKTGRLVSETQTAMTLALHFGLVEEKDKAAIAARLEQTIAKGFGGKADYSDPTFKMMVMSGADAPLRAAVLSSCGAFPANVAEGMLAMANGQPLQGLKKNGREVRMRMALRYPHFPVIRAYAELLFDCYSL